ncbi:MAG: NifU N-terminal domain-containing protein [Actinobacteria bacterium]|nr:NifU N-terminal domain-containing protein [Actinomycetota bacterium]
MPAVPSATPNPNALKFTVDATFDAPTAFSAAQPTDDPVAGPLLAIEGVTSVFMSADFVTLSKTPEAEWEAIVPPATEILEARFG